MRKPIRWLLLAFVMLALALAPAGGAKPGGSNWHGALASATQAWPPHGVPLYRQNGQCTGYFTHGNYGGRAYATWDPDPGALCGTLGFVEVTGITTDGQWITYKCAFTNLACWSGSAGAYQAQAWSPGKVTNIVGSRLKIGNGNSTYYTYTFSGL